MKDFLFYMVLFMRKLILSFLILVFIWWLSLVSAQDESFDKEKVERVGDKISEILDRHEQSLTDKFLVLVDEKIRELDMQASEIRELWGNMYDKKVWQMHMIEYLFSYLHRNWHSVADNMEWYENEDFWFKLLVPKEVSGNDSKTQKIAVLPHENWVKILPEWENLQDRSSWNMYISDIDNDNIQIHIDRVYNNQQRYTTCSYWWKKLDKNDLYENIAVIDSHVTDDMNQWCFLNFIHVDKFDSVSNKAVSWDIGQDINFGKKFIINGEEIHITYDSIMVDSFRFIE